MDSDASFGVAANTSLSVPGLITDTGFTGGHNLTKVGPGQLIFNRVGGNNYRGQTIINNGVLTIRDPLSLGQGADATQSQSGTPQSGTIVNFNPTTGEAGTLELGFTSLPSTDPNAILQDPSKPFDVLSNPVIGFQVFNDLLTLNGPGFNNVGALHNLSGSNIWNGGLTLGSPLPIPATSRSASRRIPSSPSPVSWATTRTGPVRIFPPCTKPSPASSSSITPIPIAATRSWRKAS